MTIFDISYWDQVNSRKKFCKFYYDLFSRHKTGSSTILNVASYWKSSNATACTKKLSQILVNNINNGWREIGLKIYVRSSSFLGVSLCFWLLICSFFSRYWDNPENYSTRILVSGHNRKYISKGGRYWENWISTNDLYHTGYRFSARI